MVIWSVKNSLPSLPLNEWTSAYLIYQLKKTLLGEQMVVTMANRLTSYVVAQHGEKTQKVGLWGGNCAEQQDPITVFHAIYVDISREKTRVCVLFYFFYRVSSDHRPPQPSETFVGLSTAPT